MRIELELIVLLMAALATGGLMVNWVGLARAMAQLSPSTYVELHQSTNRTFNQYMPVVVVGAIVGGVVLAVASGIHTALGQLSVFGAASYVAVVAIGVPTDVRINNRLPVMSENKICLRLLGLSLAPQPGVTQRYIAKNRPLTLA